MSLNLEVEIDTEKSTSIEKFNEIQEVVKHHFNSSNISTEIDAKHDAVFGMTLYCLEILNEMLEGENNLSILSRMGLRTLAECYITLAYLCHQDKDELWQAYRMYGSGQAKLSFLKIEDMKDKPKYVDVEVLRALVNEDQWEEFVNIDLGHWEGSNLRKMSETAKVKEDYNAYYDWTSGFAHGQWAAVRNSVYDTCGNPMHRLHRIPTVEKVKFNDVTGDAVLICNKILGLLCKMYPEFRLRF